MAPTWKAVAIGGAVLGAIGVGLIALKTSDEKRRFPAPKRVALIGDSYAVGLGPELAKIYPDFKFEGHVGNNTWQWAAHNVACGQCGDWLTAFKPDLVLVALGVNDVKPDPQNYQTIVRALHGIGARVMWIDPPLPRATNAVLNAIAATGVATVPVTTTPLAADGLHPASYGPWAQEIAQAVARA